MTVRANWTFSPHLVLQVYAQPYVSAGRYSEFKDVDHPGAAHYADRFRLVGRDGLALDGDGVYHATRDGLRFAFDRPDFNFRQLRSTVVMRWEYKPGSTLFVVWNQGRQGYDNIEGSENFHGDVQNLFNLHPANTFLVKLSYWLNR